MQIPYGQSAPPAIFLSNNPENFPVEGLPPRLQRCLASFTSSTDAPLSAVASVMFGVMSIVCQQRYVVEKRSGLTSPLSLWILVLQESGERKSTVINALLEGVREFMSSRHEAMQRDRKTWEVKHGLWKSALRSIKRDAEKCSENPVEMSEISARIEKHVGCEPKLPTHLRPILEDATSEALVQSIAQSGGSATAIVSDEMTRILKGRALNDLGLLCKAYDGSPVQVSRVKYGHVNLERALISMLLMGQNGIFDELIKKHESDWSSSGFLARFLIAKSLPRAGSRYISGVADPFTLDRAWFAQTCKRLLSEADEEVGKQCPEIVKLRFSMAAAEYWVQYYNFVEHNVGPGNIFYQIKSFASRMADKAAKLAALIHIFSDGQNEEAISLDNLMCAGKIVEWYAKQYIEVVGVATPWDCESDAANLKAFMQHRFDTRGQMDFSRTELLQYGPNRVRSRSRLDAALDSLQMQGGGVFFSAPNGRVLIRLIPGRGTCADVHRIIHNI